MTEPTTKIISIVHGFTTRPAEWIVMLHGEDIHVENDQIVNVIPFERTLLDDQANPIQIIRDPNPGSESFERALARAHG